MDIEWLERKKLQQVIFNTTLYAYVYKIYD